MSQTVFDITDRKKKLGCELYTALYYLPDTGKMIFAPTNANGAGGVYYEQDQATLLEPPLDSLELGRHARAALTAFDVKPQDLRNRKASEWAAYRVSGMKSIRAFEHAAIRVTIARKPGHPDYFCNPITLGERSVTKEMGVRSRPTAGEGVLVRPKREVVRLIQLSRRKVALFPGMSENSPSARGGTL